MSMTPEQVESRDYTFVTAVYSAPLTFRRFLVGAVRKAEAEQRAADYATAVWGQPDTIRLYPRNYVTKARALFAEGLHD